MPWCPNCKTEYQEGIEKCADCGSDLVEELPEEEVLPEAEELSEEGFEEGQVATDEELEALGIDPEELEAEIKRRTEPAKVYVSKSDESRDMVQTSVTFLVFAGLLIVLFVLGALDVIQWFSSIPSLIVLGAMSLGCCAVGINAAFRARRAQGKIGEEEKIKNEVTKWLEVRFGRARRSQIHQTGRIHQRRAHERDRRSRRSARRYDGRSLFRRAFELT